MKTWKKIVALIALVVSIGLIGYTVIVGFGSSKKGSASNIKLGLDLNGGVSITYEAVGDATSTEISDAVYKMQQRIAMYDGAQAYAEGSKRITVEIPGVDNADEVLKELGKPGAVYFILEYASDGETKNYVQAAVPAPDNTFAGYAYVLNNRTIEDIEKDGTLILTGSDIKECEAVYYGSDQKSKEPVVSFSLKEEGAKRFAEATQKAYENGWSLGIYYDGEFISVPSVESPITGGSGVINGMATIEAAKNLASNIRIGALPIELQEISSKVVGATLGQDAISTSLIAGGIGFALIFIFMIIFYRIPGIAADIALAVYTALDLLVMNVFDFSLTLPGIAGLVLSIGMAVDANVIIYARIKEEISLGRDVRSAIHEGFAKALSAIVDGNVTTLIAAIVLGIIGTGPVRGFALTLGIGIVISMFTSLCVSRWIILLIYHLGAKSEKCYGKVKARKAFNITGKRKLTFSIGGLVIATGLIFLVVNGVTGKGALNFDLEFSGGTSTSVTFNEEYTLEEVEQKIIPVIKEATGAPSVQQQQVKGSNTIVFKTQMLDAETRSKLNDALEENFKIEASDSSVVSYENISGTISSDMRRDAIIAVVVATICMLLYIWIRFRDVKFATSSIIALIHDVLVVLAFYAISRTPVGTTFIACMLTIVGYSINATIVIFDRIREGMKTGSKTKLSEVVNQSITSTLSRSINTSLTTFIMVFVLYIMGVSAIKDFAAPIMVGIVAGGFSSVFLSGALWFMMKKVSYKRALKKENN